MRSVLRYSLPVIVATLTACGGGGGGAGDGAPPSNQPSNIWSLVWSDEFDGASGAQPSASNWSYDLGSQHEGWGNQELQYYTSDASNAQMDGAGKLVITAHKVEPDASRLCLGKPCEYTSARLISRDKVTFLHGKIEARIKVPAGAGLWPAFWSMGQTGLWPDSGELDVMEYVGKEPNLIYGTAHGTGYTGDQAIGKSFRMDKPVADEFHTYTIVKRPNEVTWFVDGVQYHRITPSSLPSGAPWLFEKPFFLLLNLAVGGKWPGSPNAETVFPAKMEVDWVRIYKEVPSDTQLVTGATGAL